MVRCFLSMILIRNARGRSRPVIVAFTRDIRHAVLAAKLIATSVLSIGLPGKVITSSSHKSGTAVVFGLAANSREIPESRSRRAAQKCLPESPISGKKKRRDTGVVVPALLRVC